MAQKYDFSDTFSFFEGDSTDDRSEEIVLTPEEEERLQAYQEKLARLRKEKERALQYGIDEME